MRRGSTDGGSWRARSHSVGGATSAGREPRFPKIGARIERRSKDGNRGGAIQFSAGIETLGRGAPAGLPPTDTAAINAANR